MKINYKYLPILIFSLLATGIFIGKYLNFPMETASISKKNHKNKLNRLIDFINNEYVDNVNTDSIVDLTVDNILAKLDPHSVYISPKDQLVEAENMKGDFVGIGINFYMFHDTLAVIKPIANGPAEKAGLLAGDRILFANKFQLFGKKILNATLYAKLKGEENSEVELTVFRKSINKKIKFKLLRQLVPLKSVDIAILLNPNLGFIKINRFAETTYNEFKSGLDKLRSNGAKSLIIDLRENGGGFLEIATQIADEFLKNKQLVVFTKNKNGRIDKTFATQNGSFENGKLFVLIDENSASASEILAGAIHDNDRGTIVGRRSFGKGLVQREMNFDDGSAVRLTIARYYTPSGRSIQKPYSKGKEDYYKDFEKRFASGELYKKDSIKVNDSLKFKTKNGRIVYGGGGIVPDLFVPLQINENNEEIGTILQSGIIGHFVFEEIDQNRKEYISLKTEDLLKKINCNDIYINDLKKYLSINGIDLNVSKNRNLIKTYILAEFARQLFSEEIYYRIILKEDSMINKILELEY
ncbi:MAG: S41 family peptidase [Flavobacterium sp.]|nr:S41 family peptidase [Flavobacterium sp.]